MQINDSFIGMKPNISLKFYGGDDEPMYLRNLATQPDDWYYRNNDITYTYNEYGHRCKSINEIDLDNYILFTGCSHTEGVGLHLEHTFPYLTAKSLGVDYYNLALGGSGIDIMMFNLMAWIASVKKLPKALVILWPEESRFCLEEGDILRLNVPCTVTGDESRFMALGESTGFFQTTKYLADSLTKICFRESTIINLENVHLFRLDLARDLSHAGMKSNELLAKRLAVQL